MGRGKMDEAAAARIRKARGDKDEFARRAQIAAMANKDAGSTAVQQPEQEQGAQNTGGSTSK